MKYILVLSTLALVGAGCLNSALVEESLNNKWSLESVYQAGIDDWPDHFIACLPTASQFCQYGSCEDVKPSVFVLLTGGRTDGKYHRCDINGCDTYEADAQQSGAYEVLQLDDPGGIFMKRDVIGADNFGYTESVSIGLGVGINTGYCFETKDFVGSN